MKYSSAFLMLLLLSKEALVALGDTSSPLNFGGLALSTTSLGAGSFTANINPPDLVGVTEVYGLVFEGPKISDFQGFV